MLLAGSNGATSEADHLGGERALAAEPTVFTLRRRSQSSYVWASRAKNLFRNSFPFFLAVSFFASSDIIKEGTSQSEFAIRR